MTLSLDQQSEDLLFEFAHKCALRALSWFSDNKEGLTRVKEALSCWHETLHGHRDPNDARTSRESLRKEEYRAWQHWDTARHLSEGIELRLRGMWDAVRSSEAAMLHTAHAAAQQSALHAREAAIGWWSYCAWKDAQERWHENWGELGKQWASELAIQGAKRFALEREFLWQEEQLRILANQRDKTRLVLLGLLKQRREKLIKNSSNWKQTLEQSLFSGPS
ncbi:MAG: hypothetical protein H6727_10595 [Myxococcales bacterium]|nr:hypothetical protein [Myxococcales bacterium]